MPEAIVILKDLAVGYGRSPVLQNLNATIARGDSVGLLGANGSGKTTLLKTIAGILPPLAGEIQSARGERPVVGYVPQRETLDHAFLLTSLEIVLMGICGRLGPGKFVRKAEREWAVECLGRTGAENLGEKAFAELSGGQKQRVLIARALVARPDLLLLDEPTAGVDTAATNAITELLGKLNGEGVTIIMVNHDVPVLRRATRMIWSVRDGKVETVPTTECSFAH
jgi:zinc transport system ATP-binding protein